MEFEAIQLEDFHYMDDDLIDDMDEDEYVEDIFDSRATAHNNVGSVNSNQPVQFLSLTQLGKLLVKREQDLMLSVSGASQMFEEMLTRINGALSIVGSIRLGEGGSKRVLYVSIFEIVNNVIIPWASILNMIARLEFMKGAAMFWEMEVRSLHEHEILISSIASGFGNYRSIRKENAFCGLIVRKNFDQHRKIFDPWDILFANVTMEIDRIVRTIRSSFQLLNDGIKYLVLAEAETMFDHGFVPDIHKLEVLLKAYRDSSFWDCKQASEEAIAGKLFSDSESIQARAEASVLLKQLHFPVDSLQVKLLEKLEQSLGDIQLKTNDIENVSMESNDPKQGKVSELVHITAHEDSIRGFAEAISAYRIIFLSQKSN
ncbi:hypothetical protein V6N13_093291 [Hibiscus sabdariffa]